MGVAGKLRWMALCTLLVCPASVGEAQRMPRSGGWSVWGGLGLTDPTALGIDATVGGSGGIDYFIDRSFTLGVMAGAWSADASFDEDADLEYLAGVATYNWERGRFHPFLQGGLGLYRADLPQKLVETNLGAFGGGGIDIFIARRVAVDLAVRFHYVDDRGHDAKFFEAHGGLKFYF